MSADPPPPVEVRYTPEFKRNLRHLVKKYRRIQTDLQPILDQLMRGETPGDKIAQIEEQVFKVRVRNRDAARGKSGGYRVIYHVATTGAVILITIYSKSEQDDVSAAEIRRIIRETGVNEPSDEEDPSDRSNEPS
jgi:mRNA-degrading endonuclease RelE of RelBE toxin-antitoxin system